MGGGSSQQKNITPQMGQNFNPFLANLPPPPPTPIPNQGNSLSSEIENSFYGGGQAPQPSPTPTQQPPWWKVLFGG